MITYARPTKIGVYINSARKSAAAVKRELGCDILINGGLFDMRTFTPNCWLKADGTVWHQEAWSDFGFGWNADKLMMDSSANIGKYRSFISCVALMRGGVALALSYPAALGGVRGRSAIGVRSDGVAVVYCSADNTADACTPERLPGVMREQGCTDALMLDGGASSQCITPAGTISSQRIVHNFIAIWTGTVNDKPADCPYAEPTRNVGRWCWLATKDMNKWVQWQLNRHGANLVVDGIFGKLSDAALRDFQRAHGLAADGICGPATRKEMKK